MSDDYEIGYGKPPVHTRFRKGQSGNPSGMPGPRKRRRLRFAAIIDDWAFRSTEDVARLRCLTPFTAMARDMLLDGVDGKVGKIRAVFDFLDELDGTPPGRRRTAFDRELEEAERAEEALWNERETNTQPQGICQGKFENPAPRTWGEFAKEEPRK